MDITQSFDKIKGAIQEPLIVQHKAELTSAEIANLWNTYVHYSTLTCVFKYFEKIARDNNDSDIMSLISYALRSFDTRLKWIINLFNREKLTIPIGFSEKDVNINAPPLYSNAYILHYLRNMIKFGMSVQTLNMNMSERPDVRDFFAEVSSTIMELNKMTTNVMLKRGIVQRPPTINVSDKAKYVKRSSFLTGFIGNQRSLLAQEIAHLYQIALLNYIGRVLLTGFSQVAASEQVRDHMNNGIRIADSVINTMTSKLKEDALLASLPSDAVTTDSTIAPFSDRLMMFHVHLMSVFGICMYGAAFGYSMRHDLQKDYAIIIADAGRFAEEGMKIMMDNKWMEEPPQVINREALAKGIH